MHPSRPAFRSLALGLALLSAACGGGGGGSSPAPAPAATRTLQAIAITPGAPSLNQGMTLDLTATATYSDATTAAVDNSSIWASSNPSVASVSAMGVVTALTAGTTNVTAVKDGKTGTAVVTVTASAVTLSSLSLNPTSGSLSAGQTLDLTATAHWSNGTSTVPYDANVAWASNNSAVATVNAAGVVTAVGAGTATVTATSSGHTAACAITVTAAAPTLSSLSMSVTSKTLSVGQGQELFLIANWSNGTSSQPYATGVTWSSSNPAVATVTPGAFAQVTAVAAGSATITASASGKSATCAITVVSVAPTLSSLTLNATTASGTVGQTMDLTATANWSNGTSTTPYDTSCTWTSSNNGVATVNGNGLVTAVGGGTATITAAAGGKSATCVVTVSAAPTFDSRLVGSWRFIDAIGEWGSFYTFNANGTFTYSLVYISRSGCISNSQVVATHSGTFSTSGSLDNGANPGQIIFNCTSHFTDWTTCVGATTRLPWTGSNPHFHWAFFANGNTLRTNHADDFNATGNLDHARQ